MMNERIEQLTAQFYQWEILGRGWLLADSPIELEPTFTPFFGHQISQHTIVDDGVRHTLVSGLIAAVKKKKIVHAASEYPEVSYDLFPFSDDSLLKAIQIIFPKNYNARNESPEHLLGMLSYCMLPISFEIIGTHGTVILQFICRSGDASYVKSQLISFCTDLVIQEIDVDKNSLVVEEYPCATVDFGLREEFMRPLGNAKHDIDPFKGMFSILEHLNPGERAVFQVLFNGVVNHWQSSIVRSVLDAYGEPFFIDAPEMVKLSQEKIQSPLMAVNARLLAQAQNLDDSFSLLQKLAFSTVTGSKSPHNSLLPLSNDEYNVEQRISDILYRESHRAGMLLNTRELSALVHIPEASVVSRKLISDSRKTKAAPEITNCNAFVIGKNIHNGIEKNVSISNELRFKHTHIIGATGTGKSTLLLNMICQDITNGEGVAVLEPHGDLIDTIVSNIPKSRIHDVILIDPSDAEFPIGFNILKAHSDIEKEVLSSDLVAAFKKLSTSWGDQMNSVFANAILAFLESNKEGTLIDMRRFLIEKQYREEFLDSVADLNIVYYWQKEYPLLKSTSIGPILTRLDAFLRPKIIRNMVGQQTSLDFETILNQKKILLVKLSQGLIGTENSYLLGSFIVSKIHQAALARQAIQSRNNFFCYIDEFHHFITPSITHMLSGARKYRVGLILAHQDSQQLQKVDSELSSTLISNAGTRICFRLGDSDAKKMAEGFSYFEPHDFQNLNTGEAIVRVERPEFDFSLSTLPFQPIQDNENSKQFVIAHSREAYATARHVIENILKESILGFEATEEKQKIMPNGSITPIDVQEHIDILQQKERVAKNPRASVTENDTNNVVHKKEETQHRYLQNLIKKMAESKGYKAILEMPIPEGAGNVDVHIEGSGLRVACEVSVTTDTTWEIHNIQKCLAAKYDVVVVCCTEKKFIEDLQKKIQESFKGKSKNKILACSPENLFDFLDKNIPKQASTETKIKGYRVKVEYDAISDDNMKMKKESIAKIVGGAMRKLKK